MTLLDDLRDAPDLYDLPAEGEALEAWKISSLGEATWAMRKLQDIEARRAEIRAVFKAEMDRLEAWASAAEEGLDRDAKFFTSHLEVYALLSREASPRNSKGEPTVKSVTTPYGVVKTSVAGGSWKATDDTLKWAKMHRPDLVKVEESFKAGDAKKDPVFVVADGAVYVDGVEVPGVTVTPKTVTAKVTVLPRDTGEA